MIKETIVVEGKSDLIAVKKAVDAEIIVTSGMGITKETLERIRKAQERCGVIVLTDPDSPGETIRRIIAKKVPGVKHAFVPKEEALAPGDVGIENASPENIRRALEKIRTEVESPQNIFHVSDLLELGLTGGENSAELRGRIGKILGIGYCGAKQFAARLNRYGISEEEFMTAYREATRR